jgi:hypothetical protein
VAVRVLGAVAIVAFLAIRFPFLTGLATSGREAHGGDLYQMTRVHDFREPMPPENITPPVHGAPPESCEILLVGDSHTRFARGGLSLAAQLHERFPTLRSVAVTAVHPRFFDPSDLLRLEGIRPGRVRWVVWESAERALPDVALGKIPQPFHAWDTTRVFGIVQTLREWNARWFSGSEAGYQFLLLNSIPTRGVVEVWNTLRFRVTGHLPASIGAWRPDPPHLYLAEELAFHPPAAGQTPTSFLQARDSALVEAVASSLQEAALRLRRDFGAELLVVPVPAKASLLHADLGMAYDNFLPKLHEALGRKDVRAIDSWSLLRPLGDRAVLRTETHLSPATYEALAGAITARLRGP